MMRIVAEMMILANAAVGRRVHNAFPRAALLRRHPPPRREALAEARSAAGHGAARAASGGGWEAAHRRPSPALPICLLCRKAGLSHPTPGTPSPSRPAPAGGCPVRVGRAAAGFRGRRRRAVCVAGGGGCCCALRCVQPHQVAGYQGHERGRIFLHRWAGPERA